MDFQMAVWGPNISFSHLASKYTLKHIENGVHLAHQTSASHKV